MGGRLALAAIAVAALAAAPAQALTPTTSKGPTVDLAHVDPGQVVSRASLDTLRVFPGPPNLEAVLLSTNGAQAVGQSVENGNSDPIWFDGLQIHDLAGQLGHGNFVSIDEIGRAAGQANEEPMAFQPPANIVTLPFAGQANAITLGGPLVAFTTRDQAGTPTAGVWNLSKGLTLSLGSAQVDGLNALHTVVGRAADDNAWFATPKPAGGFDTHELGWQGSITRVNAFNYGVGNQIVGGVPVPVGINLVTEIVTRYALSRGYHAGALVTITDTNIAGGTEFKNLADLRANKGVAVVYPKGPSHPVRLDSLGIRHVPHGALFGDLSSIAIDGMATGAVTEGGAEVPYLLTPKEKFKLFGIGSIREKWPSKAEHDDFLAKADAIEFDLALGRRKMACAALSRVNGDLHAEADFVDALDIPFAAGYVQTYDDIVDGLTDLGTELRCPSRLRVRPIDLSAQQIRGL